jgi:hypothetical protein
MAEVSEEQLAQLQAEREQARAAAEQAQQQMNQARDAYARDIQQVSQYVANVLSQPNQGQGQPQPQQDESDLFVQHPNLERQIEERVNRKLVPIAQKYFVDQAQTVIRQARQDPSMPHYGKYQQEIEMLMGAAIQQNPSLANMNTVQQAYRLVLSQHVDDLVEERARARASRPVDDEEEEAAPDRVQAPAPGPGRSLPPVALGTSGAHPQTTPPKKRVRLTEGEANMARVLNIEPADYAAYRDPNIEVDVLGFKGRRRV